MKLLRRQLVAAIAVCTLVGVGATGSAQTSASRAAKVASIAALMIGDCALAAAIGDGFHTIEPNPDLFKKVRPIEPYKVTFYGESLGVAVMAHERLCVVAADTQWTDGVADLVRGSMALLQGTVAETQEVENAELILATDLHGNNYAAVVGLTETPFSVEGEAEKPWGLRIDFLKRD